MYLLFSIWRIYLSSKVWLLFLPHIPIVASYLNYLFIVTKYIISVNYVLLTALLTCMVWSNVELLLGETKMNLLSNKYVTIKMHVCVQWVESNYVKYGFSFTLSSLLCDIWLQFDDALRLTSGDGMHVDRCTGWTVLLFTTYIVTYYRYRQDRYS